jgi:hypothetical protein
MKPDKATVYELFQLEKRYVVPLYQRPYVWTKKDQWEPLWDDIEAKASAILDDASPAPHFLGALVLSQSKVGTRQIAASQVIDGQQRLTTLQVFLAAFRDVLGECARECADSGTALSRIARKLDNVTRHDDVLGDVEEQFKVWPTNADREAFAAVMTARSLDSVNGRYPVAYEGKRKKKPLPGPSLVEAYRYFALVVRTFLGDSAQMLRAGEALFEAIRHHLQLVVIDLEEGDDPQVIFETLNARGEPLLPSDLIRNLVFSRAAKAADTLYASHWQEFDRNEADGRTGFWKQKVKLGREERPRLDLFFQHFLSCRAEKMVPIAHLYQEFRAWWEQGKKHPVPALLDDIREYADAYRDFFQPDRFKPQDGRLATFVSRLAVLDTSTVYPLLLFLVVEQRERLGVAERDAMLVDLESFLVRRWICGITLKNYNRFFSQLLIKLRREPTVNATAFRALLASGSGVDEWPDDAAFEQAWLRTSAYERLKSAGVQMVLRAIHDGLLTRRQEGVSLPTLSVEHVMPQAWRNHWEPPASASGPDADETPDERRDRLIHTFGNLTLLTQSLNTEVRDGRYEKKRPEVTGNSLLLLNAYFQSIDGWDEQAILERGRALLGVASRIWPKPSKG